jgi:hypothetical protein
MITGKVKSIFICFIFIVSIVSVNAYDTFNWQIETDLEPLKSLSHDSYNNNIQHPDGASDKPDDQEINFNDADPIHISYLMIERDSVGSIICERVRLDFVINIDNVKNIYTIITPFSSVVEPENLPGDYYFIRTKDNWHDDSNKGDRIWVSGDSYHEGDPNEGIFLGPNHVYKVTVYYSINSITHVRVFWLVEDIDSQLLERWDIQHDSADGVLTSFLDKGFDPTLENGFNYSVIDTSAGALDPEVNKDLSLDTVFGVVFLVFIGSFMIQIGFALYVKFQAVGSEMGAIIIILIGIAFIGSAISLASGVVSSILDALGIFSKPAGWVWDGASTVYNNTIGKLPGL